MKKTLLSLILLSSVFITKAQEAPRNAWPATAVLPEAKDWSIGFDVVPVIRTFGNLFHSPTGNDSIYSQMQYTLVGLRVKDDKTAYRMILRLGFGSTKHNNLVTDDKNTTAKLTDTWTENNMKIIIGGGIQKNRGKGRLRGIYGGEAALVLGSHSHSFTYGNPFTDADQTPTSTDFSMPLVGGGFTAAQAASRVTEIKDGFLLGFEVAGFLGAEYFFAPKMSLSAEYAWGLAYGSIGEATASAETWTGGSGGKSSIVDDKIAKTTSFTVDVANAASIVFHVYF